jgi:hypothetical protein
MSEDKGVVEETLFYASLQKIYQLPSWIPLEEEVPLLPGKAVDLALKSLANDDEKHIDRHLSSIALQSYYYRQDRLQKTLWFYIVTLYHTEIKQQSLYYHYNYVCVFFDGSTVKPEIKYQARHKAKTIN